MLLRPGSGFTCDPKTYKIVGYDPLIIWVDPIKTVGFLCPQEGLEHLSVGLCLSVWQEVIGPVQGSGFRVLEFGYRPVQGAIDSSRFQYPQLCSFKNIRDPGALEGTSLNVEPRGI